MITRSLLLIGSNELKRKNIETHQLDSETIYFITNLLNEMDLIKIRNKVLTSALPQRV